MRMKKKKKNEIRRIVGKEAKRRIFQRVPRDRWHQRKERTKA